MPDFALDLGFDRIRLLSRRSVDWDVVGEIDTAAPDLTPRLRELVEQAKSDPDQALAAWVFLPEDQVLFDRAPLPSDVTVDVARFVAAHLEGRTPYDLSQLRADWDPHLDVVEIAAVAEETLEEADRFASAHGIDPVAITTRIDPSVFPRHPEFRELPTKAIFATTRHTPVPEPETVAAGPAASARAGSIVPLAAAAAACIALFGAGVLFWPRGDQPQEVAEVALADVPVEERPALIDDLGGVAMPQADLELALRPDTTARTTDAPLGEDVALVSPGLDAPLAGLDFTSPSQVDDTVPAITPPTALSDPDLSRPTAVALTGPGDITLPQVETASAAESFPLHSSSVQSDVAVAPGVAQANIELDLSSIPREFILPPDNWPQSDTFPGSIDGPVAFAPSSDPISVTPDVTPAEAATPAAESIPPIPPTRAENDAVQGPDELAPALAPAIAPAEANLALLSAESALAIEVSMRPEARPEPPTAEELAARLIVTAVETSLVPRDRPPARVRQTVAVAAASTAAVTPQRQTARAPEPAATTARRQVQPSAPVAGRVARAATQPNAIQFGKINLLGVFGSDGARRALVRLSNGRMQRVKVGDRIDGGRVAAIGRSNLSYVKGGRTIQLAIPSG